MLEINRDTWIIADTHFFHRKIRKYTMEEDQLTGFGHIRPENCDDLMLDNWLEVVEEQDTILHLGDLALTNSKNFKFLGEILPGNKWILLGNHDNQRKVRNLCHFNLVKPTFKWKIRGRVYYILEYRTEGGLKIYFSHIPLPFKMGRKTINIHGHIHNRESPTDKHINVSIEMMEYRPWKLSEILNEKVK